MNVNLKCLSTLSNKLRYAWNSTKIDNKSIQHSRQIVRLVILRQLWRIAGNVNKRITEKDYKLTRQMWPSTHNGD